MKAVLEELVEESLIRLVVRVIQLPGKLLVWPVGRLVRIPPRYLLSIELSVGLAVWVAVSLLVVVL